MTPRATRPAELHYRRGRRWAFVGALANTGLVISGFSSHPGDVVMTVYAIAFVIAWVNLTIQHRAYRSALSTGPANER